MKYPSSVHSNDWYLRMYCEEIANKRIFSLPSVREMDPIVKVRKEGEISIYTVKKILTDTQTEACLAKFLTEKHFPLILKENADVYNEEGKLLLRFRKNVLSEKAIDRAYEAMKDFIKNTSKDRGIASGSKPGVPTGKKHKVMSNILGFFDTWAVGQKGTFKHSGIKPPGSCRLTRFNAQHPEEFKQIVPLIKEIDMQYKELCPIQHEDQIKAAKLTPFHIRGTSFSTITTNLNFRTAAHQDKGDWPTGFGNLVVIERGSGYTGSYTGFPQYGVAVDCRTGDFVAMDVHQIHGNTPMVKEDDTSQRISLVCYLREGIIKKCRDQKMYDHVKLEKRLARFRQTLKKKQKNE